MSTSRALQLSSARSLLLQQDLSASQLEALRDILSSLEAEDGNEESCRVVRQLLSQHGYSGADSSDESETSEDNAASESKTDGDGDVVMTPASDTASVPAPSGSATAVAEGADAPAPSTTSAAMSATSAAAKTDATDAADAGASAVSASAALSPAELHVFQAQLQMYRSLAHQDAPARHIAKQATGADVNDAYFEAYSNAVSQNDKDTKAVGIGEWVSDREQRIATRIKHRIEELENLPVSLPADLRQQAIIELRALRLLQLQRKSRLEVVNTMRPDSTSYTAFRIKGLVRERVLPLRNAQRTEQFERQQRAEKERRKQAMHQQYLHNVIEHSQEFRKFHDDVRKQVNKVNRGVLKRLESLGKKQDEKEQERIRLLKAQDEAGYRALLDKEKDKRLMLILDKTDEYMSSMSATIQQYQAEQAAQDAAKSSAAAPSGDPAVAEAEAQAQAAAEVQAGAAVLGAAVEKAHAGDTYASTHRIQERVTAQPDMLKNGTLKPYQLIGLEWLVSLYNNRLNGILADEMGLGKTIQTIALITYVYEKKQNFGPFLIIVPLATVSNWEIEFDKWAPQLNVVAYHGGKSKRKMLAEIVRSNQFNVVLTTYEYITRDKAVLSKVAWRLMIIDEGHRMKNVNNKLTQIITEHYDAPRRLLLTGTPLQNKLPELWALLNFLLPKIFNSCRNFEEWFSAPFSGTNEKMELGEEEQLLIIQRLHKVLRPFLLRRLKTEVESQLPDKVEKVLKCNMSALQHKLYTHLHKHGVLLTDGSERKTGSGGHSRVLQNTIIQLRNICNHPFIFRDVEESLARHFKVPQIDNIDLMRSCGKFELLDRILPKLFDTGHRCLIFSTMTSLLDVLSDYLTSCNYNHLRMDGSTKAEERQDMLKQYNAPDSPYFIFLLSTRAGGLGLNLQTADTVIIYDSDWNPHQDLQAQDRAHRIGQTKEVRVLRLCTRNSVEEKIMAIAKYKLDVDAKVIQAGLFRGKHSKENESKKILEQLLEQDEEEPDEDDKEISDDVLNECIARSDQEFELFQKMDDQRAQDDLKWTNSRRKTRLMDESELPDWLLQKESEVADRVEKERAGFAALHGNMAEGSKRQRNEVCYSEDLTDKQFMDAIEAGKDIDDAITAKRAKKRKSRGKGATNGSASTNGKATKRKRIVLAPQPDVAELLASVLEISLSPHLVDLPGPKAFPEYHEKIKFPIDLEEIKKRAAAGKYEDELELEEDIEALASNTMEFWKDGEAEHAQALQIMELVETARQQRA
eukprot:m.246625 g.246625  ORF g.246625 m.246625 type:complete len:1254 (+) comp19067_c0_seq7:238-3999(+)